MPVAYSYIRFSSKQQALGDSLRRQVERAEKWAREHDIELINDYQDHGISAYRGKNGTEGALKDLLDAINDGVVKKGDYLVVESLDRLSRNNILDAQQQFLDIIRKGVNVVTLSDNQVYTLDTINENITQLIISISVMYRAHEESKVKGERVKKAWENKREKVLAGEADYYTARCPNWVNAVDGEYALDEEKAKTVRRIFDDAISGKGAGSITRALNAEGVPVIGRNTKWHESSVKKVLESRAAYGVLEPRSTVFNEETGKREKTVITDIREGFYPAVITKEEYYQAKAVRNNRRVVGRVGEDFSNLFRGLVKCSKCGSTVYYLNKGKPPKGATYLQCSSARDKAGCNAKPIRYDPVEYSLIGLFQTLDYSELFRINDGFGAGRIDALNAEKEQLEQQIDNLLEEVAGGTKGLAEKINQRSDRINEIEKEIEDLKVQEIGARGLEDSQEIAFNVLVSMLKNRMMLDIAQTVGGKPSVTLYKKINKETREWLNSFYSRWVESIDIGDMELTVRYRKGRDPDNVMFTVIKDGNSRQWIDRLVGSDISTGLIVNIIEESIYREVTGLEPDVNVIDCYEKLSERKGLEWLSNINNRLKDLID